MTIRNRILDFYKNNDQYHLSSEFIDTILTDKTLYNKYYDDVMFSVACMAWKKRVIDNFDDIDESTSLNIITNNDGTYSLRSQEDTTLTYYYSLDGTIQYSDVTDAKVSSDNINEACYGENSINKPNFLTLEDFLIYIFDKGIFDFDSTLVFNNYLNPPNGILDCTDLYDMLCWLSYHVLQIDNIDSITDLTNQSVANCLAGEIASNNEYVVKDLNGNTVTSVDGNSVSCNPDALSNAQEIIGAKDIRKIIPRTYHITDPYTSTKDKFLRSKKDIVLYNEPLLKETISASPRIEETELTTSNYQTVRLYGRDGSAEFGTGKANGLGAIAAGKDTEAAANYAMAIGKSTKMTQEGGLAIGTFSNNLNDAIFIIGNGTSSTSPSNVFYVDKNGNVWVGNDLTVANNAAITNLLTAKNAIIKDTIATKNATITEETNAKDIYFTDALVGKDSSDNEIFKVNINAESGEPKIIIKGKERIQNSVIYTGSDKDDNNEDITWNSDVNILNNNTETKNLTPIITNKYSLGNDALRYKNLYVGDIDCSGEISCSKINVTTEDGNDNFELNSNLIPKDDDTYNIGSPSFRWKDLYLSGNEYIIPNSDSDTDNGNLYVKNDVYASHFHQTSNNPMVKIYSPIEYEVEKNGTANWQSWLEYNIGTSGSDSVTYRETRNYSLNINQSVSGGIALKTYNNKADTKHIDNISYPKIYFDKSNGMIYFRYGGFVSQDIKFSTDTNTIPIIKIFDQMSFLCYAIGQKVPLICYSEDNKSWNAVIDCYNDKKYDSSGNENADVSIASQWEKMVSDLSETTNANNACFYYHAQYKYCINTGDLKTAAIWKEIRDKSITNLTGNSVGETYIQYMASAIKSKTDELDKYRGWLKIKRGHREEDTKAKDYYNDDILQKGTYVIFSGSFYTGLSYEDLEFLSKLSEAWRDTLTGLYGVDSSGSRNIDCIVLTDSTINNCITPEGISYGDEPTSDMQDWLTN